MSCDPYHVESPLELAIQDATTAAREASQQCEEVRHMLGLYDSRHLVEELEELAGLLFDAASELVPRKTLLRWTGNLWDAEEDSSKSA